MATERVTVEQNGERFTLEVPEGTSDEDIRAFLLQQQGGALAEPKQPGMLEQAGLSPEAAQGVETYAAQSTLPAAIGGPEYVASQTLRNAQSGMINAGMMPGPMPNMTQTMKPGPLMAPINFAAGEVADAARIASKITPNIVSEVVQSPLSSARDFIQAVTERYAGQNLNKSVGEGLTAAKNAMLNPQTYTNAAKGLGRAVVQGATAPENLLTLPYNMAAYEQAKIRQNPNAPGLEYNPYAQTVRGEVAPVGNRPTSPKYLGDITGSGMFTRQNVGTQGQAGEANRMRALTSMPYGNVTPEERARLEEDAYMRSAIRKKAFQKVMGPVAPGNM